jgi:predicted  nucleic acid-binding Zn-ribbon protein
MPYCEHCGAKYEKGEEICPKCGVRLNIILLDAKRLEIERKRNTVEKNEIRNR